MPAIKGGYIEFEVPSWERPSRPTDPGWGVDEGIGPGQGLPGEGGSAGNLPVFPLEPGQGLPGMPEGPGQGLPPGETLPPGTIWPPLEGVHHGKCILGCYVVSSTGRRTHHYTVVNIPERPDRPVDPGWGHPEGGRPGQGLPGGPEAPGQGLPGRPPSVGQPLPRPPVGYPPSPGQPLPPQGRPPGAGQPLPRPPYQPPAGGVGGVPPQRPGPGHPEYPSQGNPEYPAHGGPGEFPGAGTPPTP